MSEDNTYTQLGLIEAKAGFHSSLGSIGKSDGKGNTIAISYVTGAALRWIPLIVRLALFVPLLALPFYRQPLQSLLWYVPGAPEEYDSLRNWEAFSLTTWALGVLIYTAYFLFTLVVKNGLNRGIPGAEIHFTRYGKIVHTIKPGEFKFIVDPRIQPFAVVSTKVMTVKMPVVENNTRDNMTLRFDGTLVMRIQDTLKLLQAGGLKNFFRQLTELHTSLMRDEIQRVDARTFNRFYVEPVRLEEGHDDSKSIQDRLAQLSSNAELSVEMLEGAAEIDELDVSKLSLSESETPARRNILPRLQQLGDTYGVKILDHIPDGNRTSDEYLHTLALPLVASIKRLSQATDVLKGIRQNEIEVDIQNHVASRQLLVLEIDKIIASIKSVTDTLKSSENREQLTDARKQTMLNTSAAILTTHLSRIEGILAQVSASQVSIAGITTLVDITESALKEIERAVETSLPQIGSAVISELNANAVIPNIDVVDFLLNGSKLQEALNALEQDVDKNEEGEKKLEDWEKSVGNVKAEEILEEIEKKLNEASSTTGISTQRYTPEAINKEIDDLEKKTAGVTNQPTTQSEPALVAAS